MGKGDGKKKRKKKQPGDSTTSSTPPPPTPQPLRVTNAINVPIKRQIRYAKMNQEFIKSQSSFRQTNSIRKRTSYRKNLDEESHAAMLGERKQRNSEVDWDVILSNGNGTSVGPLMLVDGYNVIYQWSRLKKHMLKGNTQSARDLLVRDLEELHLYKGWRIECVFDGFGRNVKGALGDGPGSGGANGGKVPLHERQFKREDTGRGVRIVYSGVGASADSYIESRCIDAKDVTKGKLTGSLIVVSNDSMIRLVGTGAGALCMSSDRFVEELKAVKKVTEYRVEAAMAIANGGYVRPDGLRNIGNKQLARPILMQGAKGAGMANAVGVSEVDGKQVVNTFRGGQFIIEDKRQRKNKKNSTSSTSTSQHGHDDHVNANGEDGTAKKKAVFGDLVEGTQTLPSWAVIPNATKANSNR
jgi:predicted RNA-binding protein with PIN domain